MSTYYDFFAGFDDGEKITALGPYMDKDGEMRLIPIITRSRSFIEWEDFAGWDLPVERMAKDQIKYFSYEGRTEDDRISTAYFMSYTEILSMADGGLVKGYALLDEIDMVAKSGYDPDVLRNIQVVSSDAAAEMPEEMRKKYGHIAYIDRESSGYIASHLLECADPFDYGVTPENFVFIIRIC